MSKKSFFLIAMASIVALFSASCIKEGDFNALQGPTSIRGTFDPNLGVPLGSAGMSVNDLLNMFKQSSSYVEIDNNNVVTIVYDTNIREHIDCSKKANGRRIGRKAEGDTVVLFDQCSNGDLNIDLFDNITNFPSQDDFQVSGLTLDLGSMIKANADAQTAALMASYDVTAVIDSLSIVYYDNQMNAHPLHLVDSVFMLDAEQLTNPTSQGCHVTLLDKEDISGIINDRPRKISYAVRVRFMSPSSTFFTNVTSGRSFMVDSLKIQSIDLDMNVGVRLPLSLYLNNLSYAFDVKVSLANLANQLDSLGASLKESHLYLEFQNGIPLEFNIDGELQDADGNTLCSIIQPGASTINGAQMTLNTATNTYMSSGLTKGVVDVVLDENGFNALRATDHIHLNTSMRTSPNVGGDRVVKPKVSICKQDTLTARAYLQIHPSITIDIPIIGTSNNK